MTGRFSIQGHPDFDKLILFQCALFYITTLIYTELKNRLIIVMKKLITKFAAITSLLLTMATHAAHEPEFDGISAQPNCPSGASCVPLITGTGFLQMEIILPAPPTPSVQTVITNGAGVTWLAQQSPLSIYSTSTVTATGSTTTIDPEAINMPSEIAAFGIDEASIADQPRNFGAFKPGKHLLTWQAPPQGNIEPRQWLHLLNVLPLVSFGTATTITASEGSRVEIPIYLNGEAPSYPVRVPYTVSGNASYPDDHNAANGEIIINAGKRGSIIFYVSNDEIANEPLEEVLFSLQQPTTNNSALGQRTTKQVVLTETHLPPQLDIVLSQGCAKTRRIDNLTPSTISLSSATITIRANNAEHRYRIDWSETDNTILAAMTSVTGKTFLFNPDSIPSGTYKIKAYITDLLAANKPVYIIDTLINVSDMTPSLNAEADEPIQYSHTFGNGISLHWPALTTPGLFGFLPTGLFSSTSSTPSSFNSCQTYIEVDPFTWGDMSPGVIPPLMSLIEQASNYTLSQFESITTSASPLEAFLEKPVATNTLQASEGLKLKSGNIIIASGKSGNRITPADIRRYGSPSGGLALYPVGSDLIPTQIVDFEISGLTMPGQSISIVIPQDDPIPENPLYRKYMPHAGWMTFVENNLNSLASASKINDICPIAEDPAYTSGLTAGNNCIRLTIEDGGPNDADQQANSVIRDPGGVTTATSADADINNNSADSNSGSSGGGSGLNLLWLLFTLGAIRAYHQAKHLCKRN